MKKAILGSLLWVAALPLSAQPSPLEMTQANVQFNLALNQYNSQKLDDAASTLKKALSLVPEHPQANLLLGIIDSRQNHFKEAIAPLKIAARVMPSSMDAQNNLGVAYFQTEQWDEAQAAFEKVKALKPDRVDTLMNLGILGLRQKKWQLAEDNFSAAAKADPKNSNALKGVAEAAEKNNDADADRAALGSLLALNPDDRSVRVSLAQKLYAADKNEDAEKLLLPLKDKGDSEAEFLLGCVYYRKGLFDESRERFETALKVRPDYPEARFNLAITLYDQGSYADALAQFDKVLKMHPGDEQAKNNSEITRRAAVRYYLKAGSQDFLQGDYLSALAKWRNALSLEGSNKVIKDLVETAQAQLKLQAAELAGKGDLALQAGKTEDAVLDWSQALERDPDNKEAKQGMDKVKSEVSKLVEIYGHEFKEMLSQGNYAPAETMAQRLQALDKSSGKKAMDAWTAVTQAHVNDLVKQAIEAGKKGNLLEQVEHLDEAVSLRKSDDPLTLRLNQAKVNLRLELAKAMAAGKAAEAAHNPSSAFKDFRHALDLEPGNTEARAEAAKMAKLAKAKNVDPAELDDWYYQGVYAYAAGDTEKALGFWKKVLEADPNHRLANEAVNRANKRLKALSSVN